MADQINSLEELGSAVSTEGQVNTEALTPREPVRALSILPVAGNRGVDHRLPAQRGHGAHQQ